MKIPETITVYHGTLLENLESIYENGLDLSKNGLDKKLKTIKNSSTSDFNKKRAIRRVLLAKEHGNVISVSGNMKYARQNAHASIEWLSMLGVPNTETYFKKKIIVLKFVVPYKVFKKLCRNSYLLDRFEELLKEGYWNKPEVKRHVEQEHNGNVFEGYNEFHVYRLPAKYIDYYTTWIRVESKNSIFDEFESD